MKRYPALLLVVLCVGCNDSKSPGMPLSANPAPVKVTLVGTSRTIYDGQQSLAMVLDIEDTGAQDILLDKLELQLKTAMGRSPSLPPVQATNIQMEFAGKTVRHATSGGAVGADTPPFGIFFAGHTLLANRTLRVIVRMELTGCQINENVFLALTQVGVRSFDPFLTRGQVALNCQPSRPPLLVVLDNSKVPSTSSSPAKVLHMDINNTDNVPLGLQALEGVLTSNDFTLTGTLTLKVNGQSIDLVQVKVNEKFTLDFSKGGVTIPANSSIKVEIIADLPGAGTGDTVQLRVNRITSDQGVDDGPYDAQSVLLG